MRVMSAALMALALLLLSAHALADGSCEPTSQPGVESCWAAIPSEKIKTVEAQQASQWCWAASVSMVFAFYGHTVSQADIVTSKFGLPVNAPGSGSAITQVLSSSWMERTGDAFTSTVKVWDPSAMRNELPVGAAVGELEANRPVIVGTNGHAVVMTAARYWKMPGKSKIYQATVRDPWPGRGKRDLVPAELAGVSYVAIIQVSKTKPRAVVPSEKIEKSDDGPSLTLEEILKREIDARSKPKASKPTAPTPEPEQREAKPAVAKPVFITFEKAVQNALNALPNIGEFAKMGQPQLTAGRCDAPSVTPVGPVEDHRVAAKFVCYPADATMQSQETRDDRFNDLVNHFRGVVEGNPEWVSWNGNAADTHEPLGWEPYIAKGGKKGSWAARSKVTKTRLAITFDDQKDGSWPLRVEVTGTFDAPE